jgi:hypothetical protein
VFGHAGDVGSTRRLAYPGSKPSQIDIGYLGREEVHGRLNVALTIEDRAVEGVLDAIHAAGHIEINVDALAGRNPTPPRDTAGMKQWLEPQRSQHQGTAAGSSKRTGLPKTRLPLNVTPAIPQLPDRAVVARSANPEYFTTDFGGADMLWRSVP